MEELTFYNDYHTHPINKVIHFFCIPIIIFTTLNFVSLYKIVGSSTSGFHKKDVFAFDTILYNFYCVFYFYKFNSPISIFMNIYFTIIYSYAYYYRVVNSKYESKTDILNKWQKKNIKLFLGAWLLQIIGHLIEGNNPAFMDNFSQTFLYAPAFSLNHLLPLF